MQGHSLADAQSLPPMLLGAIMVILESGQAGPAGYRASAYRQYHQHIQTLNLNGAKDEKNNPLQPLPIDEYIPPAGWSDEDVEEIRNRRYEKGFDEYSG